MLFSIVLSVVPAEHMVKADAINIALKKPVTYSTHWGTGGPGKGAVDGVKDGSALSFWRNLSTDAQAGEGGKFPWLIVDLQNVETIDRINLMIYLNVKAGQKMIGFKVEHSLDKVNWTEVFSTTEGPNGGEIKDRDVYDIKFPYVAARYVRFTHQRAGSEVNGLHEIEIYKAYIPVETVTLNRENVSLLVNETVNVSATLTPAIADQDVIWTSSNEAVAIVDENGKVTAAAVGEAVITAESVSTPGKTAECNVKVLSESNAAKDILSFEVAGKKGTIDEANKLISLELPISVDLSNAIPTFTTNGAAVGINGHIQTSGVTAVNLSSPVTYEVYGSDNTIQTYLVEVIVTSSGQDIAYKKSASTSNLDASNPPSNAVDGYSNTPYKSVQAHYNENPLDPPTSWFTVDLGTKYIFDRITMNLYNNFNVLNYVIEYSNDNKNWVKAYEKTAGMVEGGEDGGELGNLTPIQEILLEKPVTARYIRYTQKLIPGGASLVGGLRDFEVYNGQPLPRLISASLVVDNDQVVPAKGEIIFTEPNQSKTIKFKGILSDGSGIDMPLSDVAFTLVNPADPNNPEPVTITPEGVLTANSYSVGASTLTASLKYGIKSIEVQFFVDVLNPEFYVMDLGLKNGGKAFTTGEPAVINQGRIAPEVTVKSYFDGKLRGNLELDGKQVYSLGTTNVKKNSNYVIPLKMNNPKTGLYKVNLTLIREGKPDFNETLYFSVVDPSKKKADESYVAYLGEDGKLVYSPDYRGNNIIDFSTSGYKGGGVALPTDIPVVKVIGPVEGDDTANLQAAIDEVAAMPLQENGFRGVLFLKKGTYELAGVPKITASGIILRGAGQGSNGTVLLATGNVKRDFILEVGAGANTRTDIKTTVTDNYVPVGATTFTVADASKFAVGDSVYVDRLSNARWIHEIDMDQIIPDGADDVQWSPFVVAHDRIITEIQGNTITIDAPITTAIETRWGGAEVIKTTDTRIANIGIENLKADVVVNYNKAKIDKYGNRYSENEDQAWSFVKMANVKDAWVRNVNGHHLIYSLVNMFETSKYITVQDCNIYEMTGVITGSRRYGINADGQMLLVQRVDVWQARHSYTVQARKAGPKVFLDCEAFEEHTNSEPHQRWSSGGLFDNVHGNITIKDRGAMGTGHGWAGANYAAWNTEGFLHVEKPPTATNYAIGHVGTKQESTKDGYWDNLGMHVSVRSLYLQQLKDRLGSQAVENTENTATTLTAADTVGLNQEFTLTYGLEGAEGISAQEIILAYDPNKFEYVGSKSLKEGTIILKEEAVKVNVDSYVPGKVNLTIVSLGEANAINGSANLLEIKFRSKAVKTSSTIYIEEAELGLGATGNVVQATTSRKKVAVE